MPIEDRLKKERTSDFAYGTAGTYAKGAVRTRALPAIGLEAEFVTVVDDVLARPEAVFHSPRNIVRGPLVHRTGRSYHLPTGGAVYFDTGVIELATPMIEIDRGCGARGIARWAQARRSGNIGTSVGPTSMPAAVSMACACPRWWVWWLNICTT